MNEHNEYIGVNIESLKMNVVQLDLYYQVLTDCALHDRLETYDQKI